MEVRCWECFIVVLLSLKILNGEKTARGTSKPADDNEASILGDVLTKQDLKEKDYFLPPVFTNHETDDDDEDDEPYTDYDYESKETNYKDSPELAVVESNTNKDVLSPGDKLPIHAGDNLPIFLLEPENTYVVKNKPAVLKCRAANALEVYFKCNGVKTQALNFEFVDPHTGVRIIEGEYNVTRESVEEYFGSEKYQCSCFAWTSRGVIRSQPATVELAYIKKHFTVAPESQLVKQYSPANFRCSPPPAAPFAQLYWLKNGAPLVVNDNVHITKDGDLIINQAGLLDMANYTCVAENLAGKRMTEPVLLTVFVNGGWTTWSSWSDCTCEHQRLGRRRVRTCNAPRPLNGGQPCIGTNVQKTQDCLDCDLEFLNGLQCGRFVPERQANLYVDEVLDDSADVLLGRWSQWSDWTPCDTDCLQSRRRRCLSSSSCHGKDYQVAQCPMCVRTSKTAMIRDSSSHWPLFAALSIAFLIFIVVVILGIKYIKIKMMETSPYGKPPPGTNYFGNVIKRTLTNQPDITIHEEFHTIDSQRTHRHTSMYGNKQEHLYEVPQLANSYMLPVDREEHADETNLKIINNNQVEISDHSDSSCFLSSGSSYNESAKITPSLKNNVSVNSRPLDFQNLNTVASKIVTSDGDWLKLDKCGVTLFVPDGVVEKEELFSIEVSDEDWNRPALDEGETQLSPVIRCGPKNFHFRKGVVLSFPHCASLKNNSWLLTVLQKSEQVNCEWRKVLTLGQETPGTPIFAQVDPNQVYLMSEFLSDFVLVGRSFSGLDAKLLKLALFISKRMEDGYFSFKIEVFNDTPYETYKCIENEKKSGNSLLCDPKTISFQQNCSDLCVNFREVGVGWKIQSGGKYQEISYSEILRLQNKSVNCIFVLQQTDSINCLEVNISIYQKQKQSNSVNFNLKTNDLNSNYNCKRYSSTSADVCYNVNIFENPFNYSSLSRKEGMYDFVYKNPKHFKTNLSVDNNFKTNMLTKSDRIILCKLLDQITPKGNDWRLLAESLKISSYYYYFANTCSPTENILNLWICRNNDGNMLINLSRIFRDMSRIDCATVVERRCFPN